MPAGRHCSARSSCFPGWGASAAETDDLRAVGSTVAPKTASTWRGPRTGALGGHGRSLTITNGLSLERLEEARRLVRQLNQQLAPFAILLGTEMDILEDGSLDYPDEVLASLDYVSASVHSRFKQTEPLMTA